jgi:transposase family protein
VWDIANEAIIAEGKRVLIDYPARFDGVTVLGVDEHCWRHTRGDDKFVRHCHHRSDARSSRHWPGTAARHGRGPLETGVQT